VALAASEAICRSFPSIVAEVPRGLGQSPNVLKMMSAANSD